MTWHKTLYPPSYLVINLSSIFSLSIYQFITYLYLPVYHQSISFIFFPSVYVSSNYL